MTTLAKYKGLLIFRPGIVRSISALAVLGALTIIVRCGVQVLNKPHEYWAYARLIAPVAWLKGIPLYDALDAPRTGWVYMPLPAMLMSIVGLAPLPSVAVIIASFMSFVVSMGPIIFYFLYRKPQELILKSISAIILFVGIAFEVGGLPISLFMPHVDAYALGFSGGALVILLLMYEKKIERSFWSDLSCASLVTASVLSKQTMIVEPMAILLIYGLLFGIRSTKRYFIQTTILLILSLILIDQWFDFSLIVLNGKTIPFRFPWKSGAYSDTFVYSPSIWLKIKVIIGSAIKLFHVSLAILLPSFFLLLVLITNKLSLKLEFRKLAAILLMMILNFPMSVSGYLRLGGAENAFSPFLYFGAFFTVALLLEIDSKKLGVSLGIISVYLATLFPIELQRTAVDFLYSDKAPVYQDYAFRYIKAHPGETVFPVESLAQLMAEEKLYVGYMSLMGRSLAKMPCERNCLKELIPSNIHEIVRSPTEVSQSSADEQTDKRNFFDAFPQFKLVEAPSDLPGFEVYKRK